MYQGPGIYRTQDGKLHSVLGTSLFGDVTVVISMPLHSGETVFKLTKLKDFQETFRLCPKLSV